MLSARGSAAALVRHGTRLTGRGKKGAWAQSRLRLPEHWTGHSARYYRPGRPPWVSRQASRGSASESCQARFCTSPQSPARRAWVCVRARACQVSRRGEAEDAYRTCINDLHVLVATIRRLRDVVLCARTLVSVGALPHGLGALIGGIGPLSNSKPPTTDHASRFQSPQHPSASLLLSLGKRYGIMETCMSVAATCASESDIRWTMALHCGPIQRKTSL